MIWQLVIGAGGPALAAVVAWLCTRGYYRAAYGDRYQRGYADGQEAQIRAYADARATLPPWEKPRMLPAPHPMLAYYEARGGAQGAHAAGPGRPRPAWPDPYAQLSPEQLDDGPPTSEWARDLIARIEQWNADNLPARDIA